MSPRLLARLPPTGESDSIRQAYLPALRDGERIEGHPPTPATCTSTRRPSATSQGNWNLLSGYIRLPHPPAQLQAIASSATIEDGAELSPQVVVGARSVVRRSARLDRVVVWPDSIVDGEIASAIVTPKGIFRV